MNYYFAIVFCVCVSILTAIGTAETVKAKTWLTASDPTSAAAIHILQPGEMTFAKKSADTQKKGALNVQFDINQRLQPVVGFGAGLPQSSAHVLLELKKTQPALYEQVLIELFSPENGAGLSILRFPIGSCDFSLRNTSYDEVAQDFTLQHFKIDEDSEKIVQVLRDVRKINANLQVIASPWSAPSWMKKWNTLIAFNNENTLIDEEKVYLSYAAYLTKTIEAFAERGIAIDFLTLQNEPLFGDGSEYPGMYVDAKQALHLGELVRQKFLAKKLKTKLLSYDHNWDHPEYPLTTLSVDKKDAKTEDRLFQGVAWHCYGGDMRTAMSLLQRQYPDVPQYLTECTGAYPNGVCDISQGLTGFGWNHQWDMQNLLLGALGQFAQASVKWILALDEHCGPVLPDVTFRSGRPLVSIPSTTTQAKDIQWNQDFWSLRHFSQFLEPTSSWRIVHHTDTQQQEANEGETFLIEGFISLKTEKITIVAMNLQQNVSLPLHYVVRKNNDEVAVIDDELPAFATKIYQFDYQF